MNFFFFRFNQLVVDVGGVGCCCCWYCCKGLLTIVFQKRPMRTLRLSQVSRQAIQIRLDCICSITIDKIGCRANPFYQPKPRWVKWVGPNVRPLPPKSCKFPFCKCSRDYITVIYNEIKKNWPILVFQFGFHVLNSTLQLKNLKAQIDREVGNWAVFYSSFLHRGC